MKYFNPTGLDQPLFRREMLGIRFLKGTGRPLRIAFVGNERMLENITEAIDKTYGLEGIVTSDYQEAVDWLCVDD